MIIKKGGQFFVMSALVDPTESMFKGDRLELRGIIAKQKGYDGHLGLAMISTQGSGFNDPASLLLIEPLQVAVDQLCKLVIA